jgi:hypothetical protein
VAIDTKSVKSNEGLTNIRFFRNDVNHLDFEEVC